MSTFMYLFKYYTLLISDFPGPLHAPFLKRLTVKLTSAKITDLKRSEILCKYRI